MKTEFELRVIEIDFEDLSKKARLLGAIDEGWFYQKRIIFDFVPVINNKWVRLRDNGQKVTIAVKEILNETISGTREAEIIVNDFEEAKIFLLDLGLKIRCYQENKRYKMRLKNVTLDFDFWPKIPPLLEIEGENEENIMQIINLLQIDEKNITSKGVAAIYFEKYGIDLDGIQNLIF